MTRLNVKPVFLLGLSRSGTNLLMNLLRSHPDLCAPRGELHEVFLGKSTDSSGQRIWKRLKSLPIFWAEGQNVFDGDNWTPRPELHQISISNLDRRLYSERFLAKGESQNLYREMGETYTLPQLTKARTICKCLDAQVFLVPALRNAFPDCQFISMVRHPLAICEGRSRRGYLSPIDFAPRCESVYSWFLKSESQMDNFEVVKYEDLASDPIGTLEALFGFLGLEASAVEQYRMERKVPKSNSGLEFDKQLVWYSSSLLGEHFRSDLNSLQIGRLSKREKKKISELCSGVMEQLGYSI